MAKRSLADMIRDLLGLPPENPLPKSKFGSEAGSSMPALHPLQPPANRQPASPPRKTPQQPTPPSTPPDRRIEWSATSPSPVRPTPLPVAPQKKEARIDWGGGSSTLTPNSEALVGVEDAFDHTPLQPGEQVAYCSRDKVAYHLNTWQFLLQQNRGNCCICGQSSSMQMIQLPGVGQPGHPVVVPTHVGYGEPVISLQDVRDYVNRAVIVQAYVYEVYKTQNTGTIFVRFEPRVQGEAPFTGFKLVIFPDYQAAWDREGVPLQSYRGRYIRVRGIVQVHATWGIEILVNSPWVIEVVDGPK